MGHLNEQFSRDASAQTLSAVFGQKIIPTMPAYTFTSGVISGGMYGPAVAFFAFKVSNDYAAMLSMTYGGVDFFYKNGNEITAKMIV